MFQVSPLPYDRFALLFALDEAALANMRARRVAAEPGSPCRVSLVDAIPGETLLLIHHVHQPAETPFHASHAIYVREGVVEARPAVGEMPPALAARVLSLRGFDRDGMLIGAQLAAGEAAAPTIATLLADSRVAYLHAHYAAYGCYAARIDRAAA